MKKLLGLFLLSFSSIIFAGDAIYTGFFNNKAVSGYDAVSYFDKELSDSKKPLKGKAEFKAKYMGADWFFATKENLELFTANPAEYAPQYGGFCAWAVAAKNDRAPGDPEYWAIVDNKLYLNYDEGVKNLWDADRNDFIIEANKNWPKLLKD